MKQTIDEVLAGLEAIKSELSGVLVIEFTPQGWREHLGGSLKIGEVVCTLAILSQRIIAEYERNNYAHTVALPEPPAAQQT